MIKFSTKIMNIILILLLLCLALIACDGNNNQSGYKDKQLQTAVIFKATGNTDPDHRSPKRMRGEVVVTFDQLPTKMSFNLPSFPCMVTENDISYYNGWTETYDEAAGEGSCEPLMDFENVYSRMWIENQNDARIVVRWRAALVSSDGIIAHKNEPQVAPYGPGDWVDESYIIYPDGIHVRKLKIYTYFAGQSKPFGWDRDPPNYIFEFQEMLFLGNPGHLPEDDIQTEALTLIKLDGSHKTISYDPYPVHFEPEEEELYTSFGEFSNANMFVVNTKSEYHPFTIGRTEGVTISPYAPERETRKGIFQSWPQTPDREEGYAGAALGHIVLRTFYEQTHTTLTQIYLSGFTNSKSPHEVLVPLGRSWLQAPKLTYTEKYKPNSWVYDPAQRAYLIDCENSETANEIRFTLDATEESPVYNPAFIINGWGKRDVDLEINQTAVPRGNHFRYGYYKSMELDDGRIWKNVLVVWLNKKSETPVKLILKTK
jgi:hypothetical protein